jgi:hypothetical protein
MSKSMNLDEAFERAIAAVKGKVTGPKGEFYPGLLSAKEINSASPKLKSHIARVLGKNLRKLGDEVAAWNATLEEVGGPMTQDMPMPAYLRRMITGELIRHTRPSVGRRYHKKKGTVEIWEVRSIDAWRDPESGWYENSSSRSGDIVLLPGAGTREILKALREGGFLSERSAGKVAVDDLGSVPAYIWITDKSTGEPLFSISPKE